MGHPRDSLPSMADVDSGDDREAVSDRERVYRALMADPQATADFITSMLEREAARHPEATTTSPSSRSARTTPPALAPVRC
jgi:hypothetical protein